MKSDSIVIHILSIVLAVAVGIPAITAIRNGANSLLSGLPASPATWSTPNESADPSLVALALSVSTAVTAVSSSGGPATEIAALTMQLLEREINRPVCPASNGRLPHNCKSNFLKLLFQ